VLQASHNASLISGLGLLLAGAGVVLALTATDSQNSPAARLGSLLLRGLQIMDRSLRSERFVYRHHRWFGFLISGGATFLLISAANASVGLSSMLFAVKTITVSITMLILIIGVTVFVRPSALKPAEQWANRQISPFPTSFAGCRQCGVLLIVAGALLLTV
jgi:hypothetical protein